MKQLQSHPQSAFDRPYITSQGDKQHIQHQLPQVQVQQRDLSHLHRFLEQPHQAKEQEESQKDDTLKRFTPPVQDINKVSSPVASTSPRRPEDFIENVEHSVKNDKPSDVSSSEDENHHDEDDDEDDDSMSGLQNLSNMDSMIYGDADDPFSFKSNNPILQFQNQIKFVPQSLKKRNELTESIEGLIDDPRRKNKSSVIHQCHLTDPTTLRRCLKIFYGKNELLRHQEFVHATKKKIYKCVYCAKSGSKVQSYPRHDSLARHIRRKHGVTGKENKMAVNYAKENVEVIDDPMELVSKMRSFNKPLPHPQFLNSDFTIKSGYAEFMLFNSTSNPNGNPGPLSKNRILDVIELPAVDNESEAANPPSYPRPLLESSSDVRPEAASGSVSQGTMHPLPVAHDTSGAPSSLASHAARTQKSPPSRNTMDLSYLNDN